MLETIIGRFLKSRGTPAQALLPTVEEYFARTMRLKPVVLENVPMVSNIAAAFSHVYCGSSLPEEVMEIGRGQMHVLYNVGYLTDPQNNHQFPVAIRIGKTEDYGYVWDVNAPDLALQFERFERAFINGQNPPYFVSCVTWGSVCGDNRMAGFLLEDVADRKQLPLHPTQHLGHFSLTREDGTTVQRFLDPDPSGKPESYSFRYLIDEARIDLN